MAVNSFALGFLVAFVFWLALDWSEIEKIRTLPPYLNEIFIGVQNAAPGGLLGSFSMWIYQNFLKE